jgi:hypothetical protein
MNDPYWEPLWACCQDLGVPMHWHGSSGLTQQLSLPKWDGFTRKEMHTVSTSRLCATPAQLIPNLISLASRPLSAAQLGLRRDWFRLG